MLEVPLTRYCYRVPSNTILTSFFLCEWIRQCSALSQEASRGMSSAHHAASSAPVVRGWRRHNLLRSRSLV